MIPHSAVVQGSKRRRLRIKGFGKRIASGFRGRGNQSVIKRAAIPRSFVP
jgi:hypothetical protein